MLGQFLAAKLGQQFACRLLLLVGMMTSLIANFGIGFVITGGTDAYCSDFIDGYQRVRASDSGQAMWDSAKWSRHSERGRLMAWWGTCYQIGIFSKHFAAFMLRCWGLRGRSGEQAHLARCLGPLLLLGPGIARGIRLSPLIEEVEVEAAEGAETEPARVLPWKEASDRDCDGSSLLLLQVFAVRAR